VSAKILTALHKVMSEVGYVQKAQRNSHFKYNYAGEAALLAKLRPAMLEAGLLLIPSSVGEPVVDAQGRTHIVMSYTLCHKDGDVWPTPLCIPGCGADNQDKGTYKAITGANKYLLFKLFQIETGDDPEKDETEHTPPEAAPSPGAPTGIDPAIAKFFQRDSYEFPGNDLLQIADKLVKAAGLAWHADQILKLEEDNKDHIAALNNQAPASWKEVQTALTAARKRTNVLAA
jgi:hypothetical protein